MITLIIDTSTEKSLVTYACEGKLLLSYRLPPGTQSSRQLISSISKGFQELGITAADLTALAVGTGPGSYTGIRVGTAAAYGLAFPKALPLISFCSLEGFVPESDGPFASLIDARMGGFYVLLQKKMGNECLILAPARLVAKEGLEEYLKDFPVRTGPHLSYPDPHYLAYLTQRKRENHETSRHIELIYMRASEYHV